MIERGNFGDGVVGRVDRIGWFRRVSMSFFMIFDICVEVGVITQRSILQVKESQVYGKSF